MFYVKAKLSEGVTLEVEIEDGENTYTRCTDCGREHLIDLGDVFDSGCDLYGTAIYCEECTARLWAEREQG